MEIKWSDLALGQWYEILDFLIENGSVSYANEVEDNVILKIEGLATNYYKYPTDKYKKNNDGSYRAFEINEYRVAYRVKGPLISIVRIRHTRRRISKY